MSPPRATVVAAYQAEVQSTVGSFGVGSASYNWSRVGSALGRLSQYLAGDTAQTWHPTGRGRY